MDLILSNHLIVKNVANYLEPKDILSARLVSRKWNSSFEKAFIRSVPIFLDDMNIKLFLALESAPFNKRFYNKRFILRIQLTKGQKLRAVMELCNNFSTQIEAITLYIDPGSSEMKGFIDVLKAISEGLRELKIFVVDCKRNRALIPIETYPTMRKLTKIEFWLDPDDAYANDYTISSVPFETIFSGLIVKSLPNLEKLKIKGFPNLQNDVFTNVREEPSALSKLYSLRLDQCPVSVLKMLAETDFPTPIRRLSLTPACEEGIHSVGPMADYELSCSISRVLRHLAKNLTTLELRLKIVFPENFDVDGQQNGYPEFPHLPSMQKLRSFKLASLDPFDVVDERHPYGNLKELTLTFECVSNNRPLLSAMYPALKTLKLDIETEDNELAETFIFQSCYLKTLSRLELKKTMGENESTEDFKNRYCPSKIKEVFPNAEIQYHIKDPFERETIL